MLFKRHKPGNALTYIVTVLAIMGVSVSLMSSIVPGKANVLADSNETLKLLNQLTEQKVLKVTNNLQENRILFGRDNKYWNLNQVCISSSPNFKKGYYEAKLNYLPNTACNHREHQNELEESLTSPSSESALNQLEDPADRIQLGVPIRFNNQDLSIDFRLKDAAGGPGLKKLVKTSSDKSEGKQPGADAIAVTIEGKIRGTRQVVYKTIIINRPADSTCDGQLDEASSTFGADTSKRILLNNTVNSAAVTSIYGDSVQLGNQQICSVPTGNGTSFGCWPATVDTNTRYYLLNSVRYNDTQSSITKPVKVYLYYSRQNGNTAGFLSLYAIRDGNVKTENITTTVDLPSDVSANDIGKYIKTQIFVPPIYSGTSDTIARAVFIYPSGGQLKNSTISWSFGGTNPYNDSEANDPGTNPGYFTNDVIPGSPINYSFTTDVMDYNRKSNVLAVGTLGAGNKFIRLFRYSGTTMPTSTDKAQLAATIPNSNVTSYGNIIVADNDKENNSSPYYVALTQDDTTSNKLYKIEGSSLANIPGAPVLTTLTTLPKPTASTINLFHANGRFYWLYKGNLSTPTESIYKTLYSWQAGELTTDATVASSTYNAIWPNAVAEEPQVAPMSDNMLAIRSRDRVWVLNATGLFSIAGGISDTANVSNTAMGNSMVYIPPYLYFSSPAQNSLYRYNTNKQINPNNYTTSFTDAITIPSYNISTTTKGQGSLVASPEQGRGFIIANPTLGDTTRLYAVPFLSTCSINRHRTGQYINLSGTGPTYTRSGFLPSNGSSNGNDQGYTIDGNSQYFYQPARSL